MHNLRPYQIKALDTIDAALKIKQNILVTAFMGSGKTFMVAKLISAYVKKTDRRFLILVGKQELVSQFHSTLLNQTDIPKNKIGIFCAGLNEKIMSRITIATVQSLINAKEEIPYIDLIIIDECHSYTHDGQYGEIVDYIRKKNNNVKILGLTATPFKLGHGYIYSDCCVDPSKNLFDCVDYTISYDELLKEGYLVPLHGKIAHADSLTKDLESVSVNGDYVLDQLGEILCREIHVKTAVLAIKEHLNEYKTIACFCCTVNHAEKLKNAINELNPGSCTTIHSQLSPIERQINLEAWKTGQVRIITSINIISEGFDFPELQCLCFVRPTLSARLYLQAIGRVLRISEGKTHGYILDMTDNTARFGTNLSKIRADVPKKVVEGKKKEDELWKFCPQCFLEVHKALRKCDQCGYEWPAPEVVEASSVPEMQDVTFEPDPPITINPTEFYCSVHKSKNGKMLGKCSFVSSRFRFLSIWFCMSDFYSGYAVSAGARRWKEMGGYDPYPDDCQEFIARAENEFALPDALIIDNNGKYPEIKKIIGCTETEQTAAPYVDDCADIPF